MGGDSALRRHAVLRRACRGRLFVRGTRERVVAALEAPVVATDDPCHPRRFLLAVRTVVVVLLVVGAGVRRDRHVLLPKVAEQLHTEDAGDEGKPSSTPGLCRVIVPVNRSLGPSVRPQRA